MRERRMTQKLLRFAYTCEFLLALVAIFTAWSEIGGQNALDAMHWAWKLGFSLALALGIVGYTAAIVGEDKMVNARAVRWLVGIVLLTIAMGVVTYYYALEGETGESDEPSGTVSIDYPLTPAAGSIG
jgi:hypothetical protein